MGLKLGYRIPKFNGREAEQWAQAGRPDVYRELDAALTPKEGGSARTGAPPWPRTRSRAAAARSTT